MGKSQKVSKGRPVGFVPDYRHVVETVGESEVFASPTRIGSEDSCAPNPKSTVVNAAKTKGFNIPLQFFSLSKLSLSQRKELESRLRGELEQLRIFQRRFQTNNLAGGARPGMKKEEHAPLQKNPKVDRVNSSKPVKPPPVQPPVQPLVQPPPPANKPQLSNNHVMLMKQCETLLKRLMAHQYAWVFNTPVDVVKLNIPDYFQVIKHPMDLGTVKGKLHSGSYMNPLAFASDVRLTFSNAMTYNPPGNDVHAMADVMSKFFEARWKPIEKKIGADQPIAKREIPGNIKEGKEGKTGEAKGVLPKKRKAEPQAAREVEMVRESPKKRKMTDEQKIGLSRRLESIVAELPEHIIDFLRRHISNENQSGDDEIEIDIDSLGDETLFELEGLLNEFMREREKEAMNQAKNEHYEILNESGLSNSSMHEGKGQEPAEEEVVDIGGNEPPVSRYPPVVIEKETIQRNSKCDTSSSSSGSSASTSHDSDSSSSSGSGSDAEASTPLNQNKEKASGPALDRGKKSSNGAKQPDADDPLNPAGRTEMDTQMDGDNGSAGRPVSPGKQYRAALLRGRFADTILKAREKTLDQVAKDPEKLRREREELERLKREEKARLQAEAKAAEEARKRAEAEESKRKRAQEREAARQALQQMEKTVEIDEGNVFMRDLEMLRTAPEHIASSVGETSPMDPQEGIGTGFRPGKNPLEQLGLFMKVDDEEEEEQEPDTMRVDDAEEGEID